MAPLPDRRNVIKDDRNVKNISIKVSNGNQCFYELRFFKTSIRYTDSDQITDIGRNFQSIFAMTA